MLHVIWIKGCEDNITEFFVIEASIFLDVIFLYNSPLFFITKLHTQVFPKDSEKLCFYMKEKKQKKNMIDKMC